MSGTDYVLIDVGDTDYTGANFLTSPESDMADCGALGPRTAPSVEVPVRTSDLPTIRLELGEK